MFRIEDAKGRVIRSAISNEIVTVINPKRKISIIPSGHIDSVTQGHSSNAQEASAAAIAARDEAFDLAVSPHNVDFDIDGTNYYSSLHYSIEAAARVDDAQDIVDNLSNVAGEAQQSANEASEFAGEAETAAADALLIASTPAGGQYTLSDQATGYSALHYADQANTHAQAAGNAQTAAETAQGLAEDARDAAVVAQGAAETAQGIAATNQQAAENAQFAAQGSLDSLTTEVTDAANSAADARKIADFSITDQYTLADGTTQGYSASYYAEQARQHSVATHTHSGDAGDHSGDAEGFRDEAEGFRDEAEGFRDEAEGFKDAASTSADAAQQSYINAETQSTFNFTLSSQTLAQAQQLAQNPFNQPIPTPPFNGTFSALHYSVVAQNEASAATTQSATAQTLYTNAQTLLTEATADLEEAKALADRIPASHENFHQRYRGGFTSDPTSNNDVDDLYYNTVSGTMRIYTASGWVDLLSSSAPATRVTYLFQVQSTAGNDHIFAGTDYNGRTLSITQQDHVEVYLNGIRLRDDEYVVSSANNSVEIDGTLSLTAGQDVQITVTLPFANADFVPGTGGTFTGQVNFDDDINIDGTAKATDDGISLIANRTHSTFGSANLPTMAVQVNDLNRGTIGAARVVTGNNTFKDRFFLQAEDGHSKAGLQFEDTEILPRHNNGISDGVVDLGRTDNKFNGVFAASVTCDDLLVDGKRLNEDPPFALSGGLEYDTQLILDQYGVPTVDPNTGQLAEERVLVAPQIAAGTDISIGVTTDSFGHPVRTISWAGTYPTPTVPMRLAAVGYYRTATKTAEEKLDPYFWHVAPINYWHYQSFEYGTETTQPASGGFIVPADDHRYLIQFGAFMGFHDSHDLGHGDHYAGDMQLRLAMPSAISVGKYAARDMQAHSTKGDFQWVCGEYVTTGETWEREFRLEGKWPDDVDGSWGKQAEPAFKAKVLIWDLGVQYNSGTQLNPGG